MLTASLDRYAKPVPRYTSYPTAPHFHEGIDADCYARWLGETDPDKPISLYLHVPFCDRLCWFCGCHTKQTHRYDPIARYLDSLLAEIDLVAAALSTRRRVSAIHFGGGSPTMIAPDDLRHLRRKLDASFDLEADCEISVEIDPRNVDADKIAAWGEFGMTRASIGVQDFDPGVQKAINRVQTFKETRDVVIALRAVDVASINIDILYGLPLQTREALARTINMTLALQPDRIAFFGYAHVPWMKKHQGLIAEESLPSAAERLEMAASGAARLVAAGYVAVGIDHFARPNDRLAGAARHHQMRRNFQGYTTDNAEILIGLGASSIGKLPQGYVQNSTATADYARRIEAGGLAAVKGFALQQEDRLVGQIIERLMCDFSFSLTDLQREFGSRIEPIAGEAAWVAANEDDGFVRFDGDCFEITADARPFVRTIASRFDRYLAANKGRHSIAV